MYIPLKVTTDYSILKSTIKIDNLISFLGQNKISACAICDEFLYGVMEFYNKCVKNNIKPIVGLDIIINNYHLYLYAKNYNGYQNLLKLNTIKTERELSFLDLEMYAKDVLAILPFNSISLDNEIKHIYEDLYFSYTNEYEKTQVLLKTTKIVYVNDICALKKEDTIYLDYLNMIKEDKKINDYTFKNYEKNYFLEELKEEDAKTTYEVLNLLNLVIPKNNNHIPRYDANLENSTSYLENLTQKGLNKRLKNQVTEQYQKRLEYELDIIKRMGFVDYILIVYDYVLFAKKNNIFVGAGRGSAAGSLVCYTLGITDIDPLEYNLLFERFLNPERITMPDIDIDFENTKRYLVIDYIKKRYGENKVASIMTFATLKSKLALREMARILEVSGPQLETLLKNLSVNQTLRENLNKVEIKNILSKNESLKNIYKLALKIEGFKKNISTHAAGVVISNTNLDDLIPIIKMGDATLTGITMEYLEELGLLKMDLLAIKNLTMIANILDLITQDTGKKVFLNQINLNDRKVLELFTNADTTGIFQFESSGMRNFLKKLKPRNFNDIVATIALYRPGPMDNINTFIRRKEGLEKINYLLPVLEPILKETEGIIVYQEQVMQILVTVANFTYTDADLVRRAMSKKKKEIIEKNQAKFLDGALKNGYDREVATKLYELILKFAGYGFNKSHSVSYALIGYQMAYLKVKFPTYFLTNLLNISIGSEIKTKEYIIEAQKHNLKISHPDINLSLEVYQIQNDCLILPLSIIKGLSNITIKAIIEERKKNGLFIDFIDFVRRMYNNNINQRIIELLIDAGVFSKFNNKTTLKENLVSILNYAKLSFGIAEPLILKPVLQPFSEQEENIVSELDIYGFYITNHPASKYVDKTLVKLKDIPNYFDKYIRSVVLIESIKRIKTKNQEEMAFIEASDETGVFSFVVFAKQMRLIDNLKVKDIVLMQGRVTKRYDQYQVNVNNIIKK